MKREWLKEMLREVSRLLTLRAPDAEAKNWDGGFEIRVKGKPLLRVEMGKRNLSVEFVVIPELADADSKRIVEANMVLASLDIGDHFGRFRAKEEGGKIRVVYGAYPPLKGLDEGILYQVIDTLARERPRLENLAKKGVRALKTKWEREGKVPSRPQA